MEQNKNNLGSRYNQGKLEWSLVDFSALEPMVRVLMYGAHKYTIFEKEDGTQVKGSEITPEEAKELKIVSSGKNNWKKGLPITEILDSLLRHITSLLNKEDIDSESLLPHTGHILCNALFLSYMSEKRSDLDNREGIKINNDTNNSIVIMSKY